MKASLGVKIIVPSKATKARQPSSQKSIPPVETKKGGAVTAIPRATGKRASLTPELFLDHCIIEKRPSSTERIL